MTVKNGLTARRRNETGKGAARRLRAAGQVPAVLYGKDQEPVSLTLDSREALHLFHSISVENTIVNVRIDDDKEELETLVREIQMHPFRPDLVHVDFYCIERGVELEVDIPASYVGTPAGVRDGGTLEVILHEFRVKCLPSNIPEIIEVDISALENWRFNPCQPDQDAGGSRVSDRPGTDHLSRLGTEGGRRGRRGGTRGR